MPPHVKARTPRIRLSAELRRRQLAEAAAQQFHRLGFHGVSMADVASSVGVTAPAIYRHYHNKRELLAAAIATGLDAVCTALVAATGGPLRGVWGALADVAVARRDLWTLLQRDARHLSPEHRAHIDERFGAIVHQLTEMVASERHELDAGDVRLIVAAIFAVYSSPAVHLPKTTTAHHARVLAAAAESVCHIEWGAPTRASSVTTASGEPAPQPDVESFPRSEQLLRASIRLFHQYGYGAVSLDDIGAAVGMAGPSIYHHFASKADLLVIAFTRATERLTAQQFETDQPPTLGQLVEHYVDFAIRERLLFGVYVRESADLPTEAGRRIRAGLDADVRAWTDALSRERPLLDATDRVVLVHAARAIVHDFVRLEPLRDQPGLSAELKAIAHTVLHAPLPPGAADQEQGGDVGGSEPAGG